MSILSPLGLLLPKYFKAGTAWGEAKFLSFWQAPMPDYVFKGWEEKGLPHLSFSYLISAIVGIGITVFIVIGLGKWFVRKGD